MRICGTCNQEKCEQEFYWNKRQRYESECKPCKTARSYRRMIKNVFEKSRKKHEYLLNHPCVDCGETNTVVLDFDHVKPGKESSVCALVTSRGCSWERVLKEIALCVVRCANCHRVKTAIERKYLSAEFAGLLIDEIDYREDEIDCGGKVEVVARENEQLKLDFKV